MFLYWSVSLPTKIFIVEIIQKHHNFNDEQNKLCRWPGGQTADTFSGLNSLCRKTPMQADCFTLTLPMQYFTSERTIQSFVLYKLRSYHFSICCNDTLSIGWYPYQPKYLYQKIFANLIASTANRISCAVGWMPDGEYLQRIELPNISCPHIAKIYKVAAKCLSRILSLSVGILTNHNLFFIGWYPYQP